METLRSIIDWLAVALVRALSALLCRLPPGVAVWIGERLGGLGYWLQPKRTRIGVRNVRAAFDGQLSPRQTRGIIHACYRQLGASTFELLRLPAMDRAYYHRYISVEGRERLAEARASGRPVIFLTGHFGNWELNSIAAALDGHPIVALARTQQRLPRLYRLLMTYRESKGCRIVHKGHAMKALLNALAGGELVGIVADQASRQGRFVEFFGRPALFAKGPFEMAYRKQAVLLPAFIHRVRGPYHRIHVEPPIALDRSRPEGEAVAEALQQFTKVLTTRIRSEPSQWLWMHKRWKHTPARRLLVLSDGKRGHVKQSQLIADALAERHPGLRTEILEVRWRNRLARALAVAWSSWVPGGLGASRCLRWTLQFDAGDRLMRRYADLVLSCGAAAAPANALWAAENGAKAVAIMNPAPLPLRRFALVVAPKHDGLRPRRNLVETLGALSPAQSEDALREAATRLRAHPKFLPEKIAAAGVRVRPRASTADATVHPIVAVFLGGETDAYAPGVAFVDALTTQILDACEAIDGWCLVTTSRRTAPDVERLLEERLAKRSRCRLLIVASRDPLDGTMDGMLGTASVAVVTGESISMVSEACASGRRVIVVEPPLRRPNQRTLTKHQRFLRELADLGHLRISLLPELALTIQRSLAQPAPPRRLDTAQRAVDAVAALL